MATELVQTSRKTSFIQNLVLSQLDKMQQGQLNLTLPDGETRQYGTTKQVIANIHIKSSKFFPKCLLHGDIGFGEAYVEGLWETDSISNIIRWMILNLENHPHASGSKAKSIRTNILGIINRLGHLQRANTQTGSKKNISYHYDLSNELYENFLDQTMTYSSAIFATEEMSLKQAQEEKYRQLCEKLQLKSSDHVLEIGCGWGGFAQYAATHYGCQITGITVSQQQLNYAQARIKSMKLDHKVDLKFEDYRNLQGQYDKIVSIEMIEAVGHEFLPDYFAHIDRLLKPNGMVAIQAITSPDSRYHEFRKGVDWIQKHIFPGSLLPAIGEINRVINKISNLQIHQLNDYGIHYAKTLNLWYQRFNQNFDQIKKLGFDEGFRRKWNYYLQYCEAAFYMRNIGLAQIILTRPNNFKMDKEFML